MQYLVIIERGPTSYGRMCQICPDALQSVSRAKKWKRLSRKLLSFIEGLRADGQPVPEPKSTSQFVRVDA